MAAYKDDSAVTHFRNVDLDIWSKYDLQPIVDAIGKAGASPNGCDFIVETETLSGVVALGARIVVTIYPPEMPGN